MLDLKSEHKPSSQEYPTIVLYGWHMKLKKEKYTHTQICVVYIYIYCFLYFFSKETGDHRGEKYVTFAQRVKSHL